MLTRVARRFWAMGKRRRWPLAVCSMAAVFLLNVLVISHFLEGRERVSVREKAQLAATTVELPKNASCNFTDKLSVSARKRMRTQQCRQRLGDFMCAQADEQWSVNQTCAEYFGKSAHRS